MFERCETEVKAKTVTWCCHLEFIAVYFSCFANMLSYGALKC